MNKTGLKKDFYIDYVFPFYLVLNLLTLTPASRSPEGVALSAFAVAIKLCRYAVYLISLYRFSRFRLKRKELMLALLVFGVFLIGMLSAHDTEYFCYVLVFLALIGEPGERIIRKHYYVTAAFLITVVLLSQCGVIEDFMAGRRSRHFLGFYWTSFPPVLLVFLALDKAYLGKGRLRPYEALLFVLSGAWLYRMTDSRFPFISILFVCLFFCLFDAGKGIRKESICLILLCIPAACAVLSIAAGALYSKSSSWMRFLDKMLSQRLQLMHKAMDLYPIRFFGQVIQWVGYGRYNLSRKGYNYVDNSYVQILLQYGVVLFFLVLCFYTAGIYYGIKKRKPYLCWILSFVCIISLIEPYLLRFTFNPFVWLGTGIIKQIGGAGIETADSGTQSNTSPGAPERSRPPDIS